MIYVGIDPGLTGCLAVLTVGGPHPTIAPLHTAWEVAETDIECHDTPTYVDDAKKRIDIGSCACLLREIKAADRMHVFIEKVNAGVWAGKKSKDGKQMSMGVTSAFSFGQGYGVWLGILAALEIPHTLVTPQSWKNSLMPGEPKEKDASRVVVRRLFPAQTEEWLSRKKDHGRADAILIAEYGRRLLSKV